MEGWGRNILRWTGVLALLLLVVVLIAFVLPRLGAAPPEVMLGGPDMGPAEQAQLRAMYGLGQPSLVQFIRFAIRAAGGDLGRSWLSGTPVAVELLARVPATLELMLYAIVLGSLAGVPLGVAAAFQHGRIEDRTLRGAGLLLVSVPAFVMSLFLLLVFFRWLNLSPVPTGRISVVLSPPPSITGSYFIDAILIQDSIAARSALSQLVLPVACLSLLVAGALVVRVRQALLDQFRTDHFAHARAQGMPREILNGVALRGAGPAIVAAIGGQLSALLGATAVVEYVFSWGGMGQFGLDAMAKADFAVVQGFIVYAALFSLLVHGLFRLVALSFRLRIRRA